MALAVQTPLGAAAVAFGHGFGGLRGEVLMPRGQGRSCAEREIFGPSGLFREGAGPRARTKTIVPIAGDQSSNPLPSRSESNANLTFGRGYLVASSILALGGGAATVQSLPDLS